MKQKLFLSCISIVFSCLIMVGQTYHEDDKEGIRQFLRQSSTNFQKAGLAESDTISWKTSEAWVPKLKNINLTWNNGRIITFNITEKGYTGTLNCLKFEKLQSLLCGANSLTSLNISANVDLNYLQCYKNKLTSLDLSKNLKLTFLECYNNELKSLDVTNNLELGWFVCQYNKLTSLDVTKNSKLNHFDCAYMPLGSIDVSKNPELMWFNCSENNLTSLDITKNTKIDFVFCHENKIKTIDLSNNRVMRKLYAQNNEFKFSTLPQKKLTYYRFVQQAAIDGGEVNFSEIIDLSSESKIENFQTNYKWYSGNKLITSITDLGNGKFIAGKDNIGKTLTCKMTNAYFPGDWDSSIQLVLEYNVKIVETNEVLKESLLFHKSTGERLFNVEPNEIFHVYLSNTNASLGLYSKINGEFITDIVVSNNDKDYTCSIPEYIIEKNTSISVGEYIIQPYIISGNEKTVISRAPGSFIIDRLPLFVEEYGWTAMMTRSSNINTELTDHMKIKTSQKNLLQINVDETFQIQLKNTSIIPSNLKIGLFNWSNGTLATELESKTLNGILYICKIPSSSFLSGNYVLIPYELVNNQIVFIERPADKKYYLDRFGLYVNNGIWTRSTISDNNNSSEVQSDISIYPNPVTDLLYINNDMSTILNTKLYNVQGKLIKKDSGKNTVSMSDLSKGIYILVIETNGGSKSYKVQKN